MKEEFTDYRKYFSPGYRIEVRIPRATGDPFRDGATITRLEEDLVQFQLSRDVLPAGIKAEAGTIVDVRIGKDGAAYCCRAIIVTQREGANVTARFIGKVIPEEMREYYRIDTYIPVRYRIEPDTPPEQLRKKWHAKRYPASDKTDETLSGIPPAAGPHRSSTTPLAANLSGSGIRLKIPEELPIGTLLPMELYLALDTPEVVQIIAEVVHVSPLHPSLNTPQLFNTALHFLCIDERDRDSVIKFISIEQIERLRATQGSAVSLSNLGGYAAYSKSREIRRIAVTITIILVIAAIAALLILSRRNNPKGEIEQTFEDEIRKYRKLVPWR